MLVYLSPPAFEISVKVNDLPLNDVTETNAPNAAIIFHVLNMTDSTDDVMVSLYPAANRTYDLYINFNEEPTLDDYVYKLAVCGLSLPTALWR